MPDEADLGSDREEEIRQSQIAQQFNKADKTRLQPKSDGTCLNDCGDDQEIVVLPPTPQAIAAAAAAGVEAQGETRKSFFCSKSCAMDFGARSGKKIDIGSTSEAM